MRMVEEAVEQLGGLDVLVNNAGIQISRPSDELSSSGLRQGHRGQPARLVPVRPRVDPPLPRQRARGSIVNVSSVHQLIPKPDYLGYSASKGGMQNLTRTLALEYAGRGIRVNGIGPGATITPINRPGSTTRSRRSRSRAHPDGARRHRGRDGGRDRFLATDDAAYITGQTLFVDGGLTLYPSFREPWSSE